MELLGQSMLSFVEECLKCIKNNIMIELLKVTIQENNGQKMVGVRYKKDGQIQPFIIFNYLELSSPSDNVKLKEAVNNILR
jgi:hypothetical protein